MTRRERLERRLEKREAWAASRTAKAEAAWTRAHNAVAGIPFGQPILVGHYSERRHRGALERSDNAMRAACESQDMAAHHASKAGGLAHALEHAIFSDDADAPERIAERIAALETLRDRMKVANAAIRKHKVAGADAQRTALVALGFTDAQAAKLLLPDLCGRIGFPSYALTNNSGNIRRLRERVTEIARRATRTADAEAAGGVVIVGAEYVNVTFAEKPDRAILEALKSAGFAWCGGTWGGYRGRIPACVLELVAAAQPAEVVT